MSTNGVNGAFNEGIKIKLQNRGPKSSGITWELKSIFEDMAKEGVIKDTDGKGLSKNDALNLYNELNKIHQETNRATNYTRMQAGQEFTYTAEEMKALAKAAGYEIAEQKDEQTTEPAQPKVDDDTVKKDKNIDPNQPEKDENVEKEQVTSKTPKEKIDELNEEIDQKRQEIKDLKEERRTTRRELRSERREERREARAERREARIERREERKEARSARRSEKQEIQRQKAALDEILNAEADFNNNGQIGKIVNGKYYINGNEVTKDVYEIAKTKSEASNEQIERKDAEIKPFTREQMSQITATVANLKYEITDNSITMEGQTGYAYGKNDLIRRSGGTRRGIHNAQNLSIQHAIYMDLVSKENNGGILTDAEKKFMTKVEIAIAKFMQE